MSQTHSIGDVAALTGLSRDALRWYEREGLLPPVARDGSGRRRYDPSTVGLLQLLIRLRRTGMPVAEVRRFIALVEEGAASHGRRGALLQAHRERLLDQLTALQRDLTLVDDKIDHYQRLIADGLDCLGQPVTDEDTLRRQARLS